MTVVSNELPISIEKSNSWPWRKMSRRLIFINVATVLFLVWFILMMREEIVFVTNIVNKTSVKIEKDPGIFLESGLNRTYNLHIDPLLKNHVLRKRGSEEGLVRRARKIRRRRLSDRAPRDTGWKFYFNKVSGNVDKLLGIEENTRKNGNADPIQQPSETVEFTFRSVDYSGSSDNKFPIIRIDPPLYTTLKSGNESCYKNETQRTWFSIKPLQIDNEEGNNSQESAFNFHTLPEKMPNIGKGGNKLDMEDKYFSEYKGFDLSNPLFFPSPWKRSWRESAVLELEELVADIHDELF